MKDGSEVSYSLWPDTTVGLEKECQGESPEHAAIFTHKLLEAEQFRLVPIRHGNPFTILRNCASDNVGRDIELQIEYRLPTPLRRARMLLDEAVFPICGVRLG